MAPDTINVRVIGRTRVGSSSPTSTDEKVGPERSRADGDVGVLTLPPPLGSAPAPRCRPQPRQLRAGATEQQLDLLAPEEVTVDRIGDVRSHAAVQVLGRV